jgi:hypothetical protein
MNQLSHGTHMKLAQKQLLETLAGHFAWLESTHPRKAASATARRARKCVMTRLRACRGTSGRLAA